MFGTPSYANPASAPYSTGSIPSITVGGAVIPFFPSFGYQAPDGNLAYIRSYETSSGTSFYAVEIAY